ncbi:hypothetical protein F4780DRAFT_633683 [Xylariomycetidae sp. FL0641]|nr:hypothetical protein F4780DRAFT_633683 [Xylariomycetidae sp. FL0641]
MVDMGVGNKYLKKLSKWERGSRSCDYRSGKPIPASAPRGWVRCSARRRRHSASGLSSFLLSSDAIWGNPDSFFKARARWVLRRLADCTTCTRNTRAIPEECSAESVNTKHPVQPQSTHFECCVVFEPYILSGLYLEALSSRTRVHTSPFISYLVVLQSAVWVSSSLIASDDAGQHLDGLGVSPVPISHFLRPQLPRTLVSYRNCPCPR